MTDEEKAARDVKLQAQMDRMEAQLIIIEKKREKDLTPLIEARFKKEAETLTSKVAELQAKIDERDATDKAAIPAEKSGWDKAMAFIFD